MKETFSPNASQFALIKAIAAGGQDGPVRMVNITCYEGEAGYKHGAPFRDDMSALATLLGQVKGRILWQLPVLGQPIGTQPAQEILCIWYPDHRAFLALRHMVIASAVIH